MINQQQIRSLLNKTKQQLITLPIVSRILRLDTVQATAVLTNLEAQGFIEQPGIEKCWVMSLRGKLLVYQKQERMFKLNTLQQHLKEFLERVVEVNDSTHYPDCITSIKIISEYPLVQSGRGIQIAYSLGRKEIPKQEYRAATSKLITQYKGTFSNITERTFYPHEAVRIFLKSHSQVLKLRQYAYPEVHQLDGTLLLD